MKWRYRLYLKYRLARISCVFKHHNWHDTVYVNTDIGVRREQLTCMRCLKAKNKEEGINATAKG